MIQSKISRFLFISYLISASHISAFDAPAAVDKVSPKPTDMVFLAINTNIHSHSGESYAYFQFRNLQTI